MSMFMGAIGAIVPFFFLHWNENVTGFTAFALAALGLLFGSLWGSPSANVIVESKTP